MISLQTLLISDERNHEDEIITADVPDEPPGAQHPLDHVVENARQHVDDPVAVVVAVPVVEFLEMIEVGVADRELALRLELAPDLPFDLGGPRQPGRRMHRDVPFGADQHRVEPGALLGRREKSPVMTSSVPGREPALHLARDRAGPRASRSGRSR